MIYLNQLGIICAAGATRGEVRRRVFGMAESGLTLTERYSPGRLLPLGCADAPLPDDGHLPPQDRSRNNRLALAALAQIRTEVDAAIERFGASRIGVVIGTSTSGIAESEAALRHHAATG